MAFLELNFYTFMELYCLFPPTYACSPTRTTHRDKLVTILLQPKAFVESLSFHKMAYFVNLARFFVKTATLSYILYFFVRNQND